MKSLRLIVFIFPAFLPLIAHAQKENSNWYFGNYAGVSFEHDTVQSLKGGALTAFEGCATISDTSGKLLFYTNGINVWNRSHNLMLNGDGLKGHGSSTQSAMIIRRPGSMDRYYIFTVNGQSGDPTLGAYYSEIDMRLDGGLGGITAIKNRPVLAKTDEKITAVVHKNGRDIWVLIPERFSRNIQAYLVTDTGINIKPVTSDIGQTINGTIGYIHASSAGNRIAMALFQRGEVMVADFNNSSGRISYPMTLTAIPYVYGLEFSPSGRYLYVTTDVRINLFQYDLLAGSFLAIMASKYELLDATNAGFIIGGLQLAINNKIYFAEKDRNYLGVVENPDAGNAACKVKINAVRLGTGTCSYGLQNCLHTSSNTVLINYVKHVSGCNYTIGFSISNYFGLKSIHWNFGDSIAKGNGNVSDSLLVTHSYFLGGNYKVTAVLTYDKRKDTIIQWIYLDPVSNLYSYKGLPGLVKKCPADSVKFSLSVPLASYQWNTGDTASNVTFLNPGSYSLIISDTNGCKIMDSVQVINYPVSTDLGVDLSICADDSILLTEKSAYKFTMYRWNTGDSASTIYGRPGMTYTLSTKDSNSCSSSDTLYLHSKPLPEFSLGKDTVLCEDQKIEYNFNIPKARYQWQDNDTSGHYTIANKGLYTLTVQLDGCRKTQSIHVEFFSHPIVNLGGDDSICINGFYLLDAGTPAGSYIWSTGEKSRAIQIGNTGTYWVRAANGFCAASDSITLFLREKKVYVPNAFTPDRNGINELFRIDPDIMVRAFSVYNNWGELVFQSNDLQAAWDGTYMDKDCEQGVYLLVISYWDCSHQVTFTNQVFTLLR